MLIINTRYRTICEVFNPSLSAEMKKKSLIVGFFFHLYGQGAGPAQLIATFLI